MTITTLTSREFNQNPSEAKKAAQHGAVFITDRGQPAHALLSIDAYRQLTGQQMTLLDAWPNRLIRMSRTLNPDGLGISSRFRICSEVSTRYPCRFRVTPA